MLPRLPHLAASALAAVLAGAVLGCGGSDADSASGDVPDTCTADPAELRAVFRPLPDGLRYGRLPRAQLEDARKELGDAYQALEARLVTDRETPVATVLVQVVADPIRDEDEHLRGVASGFGAEGSGERIELNGRDVLRIERDDLTAYVSVYESCRTVSVVGLGGRSGEGIARAVLR